MSTTRLTAAMTLAIALSAPGRAQAETYHTCAGFIDSLPAVIRTQGTWCLRRDLSTRMVTGEAITIAANNVTIDCNGFKIGGLPAGTGTGATAILAEFRLNAAVRHCAIRGFSQGIAFIGTGGGHLVEDNRFEANRAIAIDVNGDGSAIRRNSVSDSGGGTSQSKAIGINALGAVDIRDNVVQGMAPDAMWTNATVTGIVAMWNDHGAIAGNRVGGLVSAGRGVARGIDAYYSGTVTIRDNILVGDGRAGGTGIECGAAGVALDNVVHRFATPVNGCTESGTLP